VEAYKLLDHGIPPRNPLMGQAHILGMPKLRALPYTYKSVHIRKDSLDKTSPHFRVSSIGFCSTIISKVLSSAIPILSST